MILMDNILEHIKSPEDLKRLGIGELVRLAAELREFIISNVSSTGGHLASSLGAVELAIALHYVFSAPADKIVWDVGHQAYAHKILTGRKDRFHTLRQLNGLSGFPRPAESVYDAFGVGHSSTSISAALGMAAGRDLSGGTNKVVAVIGDGSLTAGIAFEGLNQAGHLKKDIIVVLNDNEMSISPNVGALSSFLSRKITGRFATMVKKEVEAFMKTIPMIGDRLVRVARRAEDALIAFLTPGMLFEGLGFHYIGPVDGHDMQALASAFQDVNDLKGPVLLHVLTKKGKGYAPAENDPAAFHGVGAFDVPSGAFLKSSKPSYTNVFSAALLELAESDKRVVAITAAMPEGTGLAMFSERFPDRFFDVGIAEQHAITFAAGLAMDGFVPVTAIYSTFLQRAYDQVFHDVCLQNLPVVFALDRAGLVGQDGATHHGLFDIAYLRHLPNIIIAAPKDEGELRHLLYTAVRCGSPMAVRYPRGNLLGADISCPMKEIPIGRAETLKVGDDLTILALGTMVQPSLEAAERLEKSGIGIGVVNVRFVKPLDEEAVLNAAASRHGIVTVEEGALMGGFGSAVLELLAEAGVRCPVRRCGVPDEYIEHGTQEELRAMLGLNCAGIEAACRSLLQAVSPVKADAAC